MVITQMIGYLQTLFFVLTNIGTDQRDLAVGLIKIIYQVTTLQYMKASKHLCEAIQLTLNITRITKT